MTATTVASTVKSSAKSPPEDQETVITPKADIAISDSVRNKVLLKEEDEARQSTSHNALYLFIVNSYSAFLIFALFLVSMESFVSLALSIGLTILVYFQTQDSSNFDGSTMNWVMLSFAVITPISVVIRLAFTRREQALFNIANARATMIELYAAHACWDWNSVSKPNSGRAASKVDWRVHSDLVLEQILGIADELTSYLTLPTSSRARHITTKKGHNESESIDTVACKLQESIVVRFGKLADLCEVLKYEGLPPNEATRVRQWERFTLQCIEVLRVIKNYRTPQALRSFARLFSIFMPPFYAPYYAQLAHDLDSLGMAIAFSCLTSIALTALFETVYQMEDPFVEISMLDGIRVRHELLHDLTSRLLSLRQHFFPQAPGFICKIERQCQDDTDRKVMKHIRLFSE